MLENLTVELETSGNITVVQQEDAENSMDGSCEKEMLRKMARKTHSHKKMTFLEYIMRNEGLENVVTHT